MTDKAWLRLLRGFWLLMSYFLASLVLGIWGDAVTHTHDGLLVCIAGTILGVGQALREWIRSDD